jgi:hypothetical protein
MEYTHLNEPNPGRLIESLRHLGYGNADAVADLADNAIDANANAIFFRILSKKDGLPQIIVADNGDGMNHATLDQAMRLGSESKRDRNTDLGYFGMGLVTASLSISRACHVVTRDASGECWSSAWDIDFIKERGFYKHLASATSEEIAALDEIIGQGHTGTMVVLSRCDNLQYKRLDYFAEKVLSNHLGRVFRYFLQTGDRTMTVNGTQVPVIDPLQLDNKDTEVLMDDNVPVTVEDAGGQRTESVRVRIALVPATSESDTDINRSMRTQGFYVMRNLREIKDAETLGFFTRHNDFNRVRGEIFLPGTLDPFAGIEFTKRQVNFEQSFQDQLGQIIRPTMKTIKRRGAQARRVDMNPAQQEMHLIAAKAIAAKDKLLLKPKAQIEQRDAGDGDGDGALGSSVGRRNSRDRANLNRTQAVESALNCEIREERLGPNGQIYECEMLGRKIILRYNVEHPFYQRFVADNANESRLVTVADFLIYSMACAELRMLDDGAAEVVGNFKFVMSANLRMLLN